MARHKFDLANPPKLSDERKAALKALANRPDSEIDYSDIPPLTEKFWKNAVRRRVKAISPASTPSCAARC